LKKERNETAQGKVGRRSHNPQEERGKLTKKG